MLNTSGRLSNFNIFVFWPHFARDKYITIIIGANMANRGRNRPGAVTRIGVMSISLPIIGASIVANNSHVV